MLRQLKLQRQRQDKGGKDFKVDVEFLPGGDSRFPDITIYEGEKETKYFPVKTGVGDGTIYQKEGEEGISYQNGSERIKSLIDRANYFIESITEAYENGNLTINEDEIGKGNDPDNLVKQLDLFINRIRGFNDEIDNQISKKEKDLKNEKVPDTIKGQENIFQYKNQLRKNFSKKYGTIQDKSNELELTIKRFFEKTNNSINKSKALNQIPQELLDQLPTLEGVISQPEERLAQVNESDDVTAKLAAKGLNEVSRGGALQNTYVSTKQKNTNGINV